MTATPADHAGQPARSQPALARKFRLASLQTALILPYVLLTLLLAAAGIYIVTRLVTATIRERFVNRISEAARVASDAIVRQENIHLEDLYQAVFTVGVPEAISARDPQMLEELLLPLAVSKRIEIITVLYSSGQELLTLGVDLQTGAYRRTTHTVFYDPKNPGFSPQAVLVQKLLSGAADASGDKYVALIDTDFGLAFFTGAPVYSSTGRVIGAVLVGKHLASLQEEIASQSLASIALFDQHGNLLTTTLPQPQEARPRLESLVRSLKAISPGQAYDLNLYGRDYQIVFTQLQPRNQFLGWIGVILPSSYVVATETTSRNLLALIFSLGTVAIIIIGFLLSQNIARPILKLRSLAQAVASGNLEQRMGLNRSDEIGDLADAFDLMTLRLRLRTQEAARLYAEAIQRNQELADTNARLRATQLQLIQSEKLAAIGQLTAGIVHDVKNPIAVIKGVSEFILIEENLSDDLRRGMQLIFDSAGKANHIISDLLKFARQSTPEMAAYDLRDTIEAALRLAAFPIRKAHVEVIKDLPDQPLLTMYDAQQIEQVLMNLITNAVQAMPDGGTLRIVLSQANSNGADVAAIAVQDSGVGIPAENLSRIFDPFFTTKPEGEGTGLGLSVSYGIVTNHGGVIQVESEVGKGTTFTILLPVRRPLQTEQSSAPATEE